MEPQPLTMWAALYNSYEKSWQLSGLNPSPVEEWDRMKKFLGFSTSEKCAMLAMIEPLFRRGHELVVNNYQYLLDNHETAAILGWENGVDLQHLEERRRFFTVWLARILGMDMSHDFANYMFRAGQIHAAHGPRQIHVPEVYVTGAVSLINASFARILSEELPGNPLVPPALAGWNKVLSLHLHMMLLGYRSARDLEAGDIPIRVSFFGRMRDVISHNSINVHVPTGSSARLLVQKLFNYFPLARSHIFDIEWLETEHVDTNGRTWITVEKAYRPKHGWRILYNGRELVYLAGLDTVLEQGNEIQVFPPGR